MTGSGQGSGRAVDPGRLDPALVAALERFAANGQVLVAVDFDGTMAPLREDPAESRALPEAQAALAALAQTPGTRVALVSGRSLADLRRYADPPPQACLIGSHGAEVDQPDQPDQLDRPSPPDEASRRLLERITAALATITGDHAGTSYELKPTAAVLHTRRAARAVAQLARQRTLDGPAAWSGVHVTEGKEVVELAVSDVTKGTALRRLRVRLALPPIGGVLYLGDDVTDERAFAVLDDDAGDVTIKVGTGETIARHRVAGPPEVAEVLSALHRLRLR